jgi:hypothetical protein
MAADLRSFIVSMRTLLPTNNLMAALAALAGPGFTVKLEQGGRRGIISPIFAKRDFTREFSFDCNGIVFDTDDGTILALPIPSYNPRCAVELTATTLAKYTVQPVRDGTTITLYYYEDAWRIATAGGFDMGKMAFIGVKTYAEVLAELAPGLTDRLARTHCYTLGFCHESYHPLARAERGVWLYASCDLSAVNAEEPTIAFGVADIGVPTVKTVDYADCSNALSNYLAGGAPVYGYILRGEFAELGPAAAIMVPSPLMKQLTKLFYNLPHKRRVRVDAGNRLAVTCLLAYLDHSEMFARLFPGLANYRRAVTELIDEAATQAMAASANRSIMTQLQRQRRGNDRRSCVGALARAALAEINRRGGTFNPTEDGARSTVRDHIMRLQPQFLCDNIVSLI